MDRRTVSVWVGDGKWVSVPCGTPERPLTDEELREARGLLEAELAAREALAGDGGQQHE